MSSTSCPIDEATLAEYNLGLGRSRLSPAEGRFLKDKGSEHYPENTALLLDTRRIRPDSPHARQAEVRIKALRYKMFNQLLPMDLDGKS